MLSAHRHVLEYDSSTFYPTKNLSNEGGERGTSSLRCTRIHRTENTNSLVFLYILIFVSLRRPWENERRSWSAAECAFPWVAAGMWFLDPLLLSASVRLVAASCPTGFTACRTIALSFQLVWKKLMIDVQFFFTLSRNSGLDPFQCS